MHPLVVGLGLVVMLGDVDDGGPFGGLAHARRTPRIESFWRGLPPANDHATASGIVTVRPAIERRVRIAGGQFVMGSTKDEIKFALDMCAKEPLAEACSDQSHYASRYRLLWSEGLPHEVTLSTFELDRTEVSVEKYGRCVAASVCSPPSFSAGDARYDVPSYPVTHVRWEDANTYCRWVSGRLPTEAEWEFAARGRAGHTFPWGNVYNPRLANHGALSSEPTDARDGFVGLAPIGSFPDGATPTGLLDMAGNVKEWVSDWFELVDNGNGYRGAAQTNPKGPPSGQYGHVIRGGSYLDAGYSLRTSARSSANLPGRDLGFRCAYEP